MMATSHPLTDHDDIRTWAEARHAHPACVKRTGGKGDPGMIRLDFPGFSGKQSLSPISWKAWFKSFDDNGLALLVQEHTARGQRSNFNKLVSRDSVKNNRSSSRRSRSTHTSTTRKTATHRRTARATAARSASPSSRKRSAAGTKKRATSTRQRASAAHDRKK
jgi:hypothetical protein